LSTPPPAALEAAFDASRSAAVLDELARVLAAPAFAGALAHQRLLRHLVQQTLAGQADALKETVLGIEVFQRPAHSFDPRRDSIVRVEARRLRQRLQQHYASTSGSALMIVLPTGSYRPQFVAPARPPAAGAALAQAVELVERGQFFLRQGHEEGHRKALARFEAAALAAPDHADAHAGVARAWLQLVATNLEPPLPGVDQALAAVRRALALQPAQADALVLAAQLTHRFEFDWPAARALFERAIRVAPASAYVHHAHALSLMMRADFDGADTELACARQHDPLHLGLRAHQALLHLYRRQWTAAATALRALLDMSADNVLGMSLLAYVALCQGDAASALVQYREVAARHPGLSIGPAGTAQALAALGQHRAARQAADALVNDWSGRYLSPYQLAMVEVRLGQPAVALGLLRRAVDERDPNALCLPVDPAFDSLHGQPDFEPLRQRVLGPLPPTPLRARPGARAVAAALNGPPAGLPGASATA
jgi:tetratricopeptide (TPR) repeat protein